MMTVYGFSTENWKRDSTEISLLLDLCVYFAQSELAELRRNNVRVNVIGHYEQLPAPSRDALDGLMAKTSDCTGLALNLAVNYSGRSEVRDAVVSLARDVQAGLLAPEAIDEARIASYLYTANMPDPDMLIRPGGESRLSNFLLYQAAYTELLMTDVYWPDFGRDDSAVSGARDRRARCGRRSARRRAPRPRGPAARGRRDRLRVLATRVSLGVHGARRRLSVGICAAFGA
jgi:undecaprenyl diphosphate synthase